MKSEYFIVLAAAFLIPFIKSFSKEINFYKPFRRLFLSIGIPFAVFIIWDVIAVAKGHWSYNEKYVAGVRIFNLPAEEILFFLIIPFCALFTWEAVKYFMRKAK
jgi:lycopene cyclase domain-containing protein